MRYVPLDEVTTVLTTEPRVKTRVIPTAGAEHGCPAWQTGVAGERRTVPNMTATASSTAMVEAYPASGAGNPAGPRYALVYGEIWEMRVSQLPIEPRVPLHVPKGAASYCASVHVWPMYSLAIQIDLPSATAAP